MDTPSTTALLFHVIAMEETKSELNLKTKISFSVESLLSTKSKREELEAEPDEVHDRLKASDGEEEDDEDITVDEDVDDVESRSSLSPNSSHTVIVPQPLHPSLSRMMTQSHPPPWSFPWVGHGALLRSSSPQGEFCGLS